MKGYPPEMATSKAVYAVLLILFLIVGLPMMMAFPAQIGTYDPRQVDNDILRHLERIDQRISDLEKRIDIHRTEIDNLDVVPAKQAERIRTLEDFVISYKENQARDLAETRVWRDRMDGWIRWIFGFILAGITAWVTKEIRDRNRHRANMLRMDNLVKNTDGMTERIEVRAEAAGHLAGHDEGRAEGVAAERADPGHGGEKET